MDEISIEFRDINKNCCEALEKEFKNIANITVINSNICQGSGDAVVSAGIFFGFSDSGIDGAINTWMSSYDPAGDRFDVFVRSIIKELYYGEQPIGSCLIVPTKNPNVPLYLHVPTMRVPQDVSNTYNAYSAFRGLLVTVLNYNKQATEKNKIRKILCSSFCTSTGCMNSLQSAKQMRFAWDSIIKPIDKYDWNIVWNNHRELELLIDNSKNINVK
jgi:O-acetyl-ADP-ribose deacetylase (regulator of RNase III)